MSRVRAQRADLAAVNETLALVPFGDRWFITGCLKGLKRRGSISSLQMAAINRNRVKAGLPEHEFVGASLEERRARRAS